MAVLLDSHTRLLVQGLTGREGLFHAKACRDYGTSVVGGVTPGKGGLVVEGFPVFHSVAQAKQATGANATLIFVPAPAAADAILEALDSGLELIVCITEGIPALDMVKVRRVLPEHPGSRLIGPNCPGIISPGLAKAGIMPGAIHQPGPVGVVSRSGTLTYEAVGQLTAQGLGQSTCLGIGGDPMVGTSFIDVLCMFEEDPKTEGVVMIGEIGGSAEEETAAFIRDHVKKPVVAFIAGQTAPPGRRMGHAGAIVHGGQGTALDKMAALKAAGVYVMESPADIGKAMALSLKHA